MIYRTLQPSSQLRALIKDYLLLEFDLKSEMPVPVKPFAVSPEQGITFYIKGAVAAGTAGEPLINRPHTVIFGQPLYRQNMQPTHRFQMLNIIFQPGTLSRFLNIPLTEFVHKNIDAELIWGSEINQVSDQMANATDYTGIIAAAEAFLLKKQSQIKGWSSPADNIARHIFDTPHLFKLENIASHACLSPSQLERRFVQQMGVTPKFYARVCRFFKANQVKQTQPDFSWQKIAWLSGYSDYQHLVKDFKRFSATTPNLFIHELAASPERKIGLLPPGGYL